MRGAHRNARNPKWLLAASAAALLLVPSLTGLAQGLSESAIRLAFIYNFSKFVEWPAKANEGRPTYKFCFVGAEELDPAMEGLRGKSVAGKPIEIARPKSGAAMRECHLLYVSQSESWRLNQVLSEVAAAPVLTVGDADSFLDARGMIYLYWEGDRPRFSINLGVAQKAGLSVSSKLLELATAVRRE